jgi:hypothetical protein
VTIDGAVAENRRVQLRSDAGGSAAGTPFGIIHIRHHNTADGFELLNPDGTLRYEPDPDNPGRHRPLRFEIRLMPRATWWQYIIEKPDASQLPNIDTDFGQVSFSAVSKTLITNTPRPLTAIRTQLLVDTDHALPNPGVETLQIDTSNERYISQFFLPTIKLT